MKIKYIVSVGSLVAMLSGPVMAGFVKEDFAGSQGDSLENYGQWRATSASVMVSNKTARVGGLGTTSAAIPILQTLSNVAALGASETNVWTDFWTIPRPLVSDAAPAVDINSSAMFFVTNTSWAVVYGAGGSDTNVCENDIWNDPHTVANDGSTWHRVSVLHNYTAKKWSLFVDGVPLKTNMAFISNVPNYQWFAVQNGGGAASNVTWIDEVLITNRVPSTLTADHDANGMYDAWEMMYFGSIGTASPTADADGDGFNNSQESKLGANPGVQSPNEPGGSNMNEFVFNVQTPDLLSMDITNEASKAMRLVFTVGENWTYQVVRSQNEDGPYSYIGEFYSGAGPARNWFVDPDALDGQKYYYRLVSTNGGISATNTERAVFYKQPRTQSNVYYWVGVPVGYPVGENKLESTLGTQLARGLSPAAVQGDADEIAVYAGATTRNFWLGTGPTWMEGSSPAVYTIEPGQGILVTRKTGGVAMTNTVFAGVARTSGSFDVSLDAGWNLVNWAGDTPTNSTGWGLGNAECDVGDEITINNQNRQQTGRTQNFIYLRYYGGGVWKDLNNYNADISNIKFFPGDAVFIRKRTARATTWTQEL